MPYPTSLRIVNWIKWLSESKLSDDLVHCSLWNQLRWLSDRPEYHVLGNHLFSNAKALLFGGVFFQGQEAEKWRYQAFSIIDKQLDEQFQYDGSQFELSPMYHALAMEDLMDILNISESFGERFDLARIRQKVAQGLSWLEDFTYTNGEYAHFNDTANGIAPTLSDLKSYALRLGLTLHGCDASTLWLHPESGHAIFKKDGVHLIADVGKAGPDYLMAHAHADTLSFELEWQGQRLIVNSGTSLYEVCPERHRQRSTAAHSTVTIDGENSSEVWSSFRVARRAYPFGLEISQESRDSWKVQCAHDGYRRLRGKPVHQRSWRLQQHTLTVEDRILGPFRQAIARYYLHPDLQASIDQGVVVIRKGEVVLATCRAEQGGQDQMPVLRPTTYHPAFGLSIPNQCIECAIPASGLLTTQIQLHEP